MPAVEQQISVGSRSWVAKVAVDPSQVRGEGGPTRPTLVVPMTVTSAISVACSGNVPSRVLPSCCKGDCSWKLISLDGKSLRLARC